MIWNWQHSGHDREGPGLNARQERQNFGHQRAGVRQPVAISLVKGSLLTFDTKPLRFMGWWITPGDSMRRCRGMGDGLNPVRKSVNSK